MAIVADLSGNSPIGFGVDPHISRPGEQPALIPGSTVHVTISSSPPDAIGPFDNGTTYLRIAALASINYAVDEDASVDSTYLQSGAIEYIRIKPGQYLSLYGSEGDQVYVDEAK